MPRILRGVEGYISSLVPESEFDDPELDLQKTPARVRRMWSEMLEGYLPQKWDFTTFPNPDEQSQLIVVRDLSFVSTCAHHRLPFRGKAHVGYIPDRVVCGLSKIPRTVDLFAHRFQTQERLGRQVADFLVEKLAPKAVIVMLSAEHLCMSVRGVRKAHAETMTVVLRGIAATTPGIKEEFLSLVGILR